MTKQELITKLQADYEKVGEPVQVESSFGVNVYDTPVFEVTDKEAVKKVVPFYIKDEGSTDESAYLRQEVAEEHPFKTVVATTIKEYEDNGTILKGVVTEINEEKQFAIVRAFIEVSGVVSEKKYFIHDDGKIKEM